MKIKMWIALISGGIVAVGLSLVAILLWGRSDSNAGGMAMRAWTYGDFTMQVPAGWTSATTIPGGSSDVIVFTSGTGDEYVQIEFNRCSGCNSSKTISNGLEVGYNSLMNYVPSNATDVTDVSPWEVTYALTQPFNLYNGSTPVSGIGHVYQGAAMDDHELTFSLTVQIAVRSSDSSLAHAMIQSLHQSSTP